MEGAFRKLGLVSKLGKLSKCPENARFVERAMLGVITDGGTVIGTSDIEWVDEGAHALERGSESKQGVDGEGIEDGGKDEESKDEEKRSRDDAKGGSMEKCAANDGHCGGGGNL